MSSSKARRSAGTIQHIFFLPNPAVDSVHSLHEFLFLIYWFSLFQIPVAAAESAEGKRASTEDDESVEFSFPIMHVGEGFDDGYPHTDSYGHQSRVTPERSKPLAGFTF
jgi:hypothetical protein